MRVVFDTNILVSALLFPGSITSELFRAVRKGDCELVVSGAIILEMRSVLIGKFKISEEYAKSITDEAAKFATFSDRHGDKIKVVKGDDSDNRILECALAAKADYLVSGDKRHILPLKKIGATKIVSARDFLKKL